MTQLPSDEVLTLAHDAGMRMWPAISLSQTVLANRARELGVTEKGLESWPGDFYLACAAGGGSSSAISTVDRLFVSRLTGRIRRLGANDEDTADVLQSVRERLFVGLRPRIRAYNATAPLEQWIKVVAIRTAVDRHRVEAHLPRVTWQPLDNDLMSNPDIPDTLFKTRFRAEFEQVLQAQISNLSERDRSVLGRHLIEGVSIEAIATAWGVHRVTVARWIWNAGDVLLEALRRHFKDRYGMVPSECESLVHLVRSQLSLDLSALFGLEQSPLAAPLER